MSGWDVFWFVVFWAVSTAGLFYGLALPIVIALLIGFVLALLGYVLIVIPLSDGAGSGSGGWDW